MPLLKRIVTSSAFQETVATMGAWYLRLVWHSTRTTIEPADIYETADQPLIIGLWHGQHFMAPFIKRKEYDFKGKVLISRHRDGEINARAAEKLGIGTIRGSGAHNTNSSARAAFINEMVEALKDGYGGAYRRRAVARVAGMGTSLAQRSAGRLRGGDGDAAPHRLNSWDRAAVNLPFGRGFGGEQTDSVPEDADDVALEAARASLNVARAATARLRTVDGGARRGDRLPTLRACEYFRR